MRTNEIEAWAMQIVQRVSSGQPVEDSRVELKGEWPDKPDRVARRIAGHCNAAKGAPVLWLIGVDESTGIVPHKPVELADWWNQVKTHFDEVPPVIRDLSLTANERPFTALLFETDRAPYVVKVAPASGGVTLEVPWREATAVRSARRHEMISLFGPTHWQGRAWAFDAHVQAVNLPPESDRKPRVGYEFSLNLYFEHHRGGPLSLPLPRALVGVFIAIGAGGPPFILETLWTQAMDERGISSTSQVFIERSGSVVIGGSGILPGHAFDMHDLSVAAILRTASNETKVQAFVPLVRKPVSGGMPSWIPLDKNRWIDATSPPVPLPPGLERDTWFTVVKRPRFFD